MLKAVFDHPQQEERKEGKKQQLDVGEFQTGNTFKWSSLICWASVAEGEESKHQSQGTHQACLHRQVQILGGPRSCQVMWTKSISHQDMQEFVFIPLEIPNGLPWFQSGAKWISSTVSPSGTKRNIGTQQIENQKVKKSQKTKATQLPTSRVDGLREVQTIVFPTSLQSSNSGSEKWFGFLVVKQGASPTHQKSAFQSPNQSKAPIEGNQTSKRSHTARSDPKPIRCPESASA